METVSDLTMWNVVVAFFLPLAISVVQQPNFSNAVRSILSFLIFVVVAFATTYLNNQFDTREIVTSVLTIFVVAITSYKGFFKPIGVSPAIEAATSPKP